MLRFVSALAATTWGTMTAVNTVSAMPMPTATSTMWCWRSRPCVQQVAEDAAHDAVRRNLVAPETLRDGVGEVALQATALVFQLHLELQYA